MIQPSFAVIGRGGSGALVAEKCRQENMDATIYLADTFHGIVNASDKDNKYRGGEFSDTSIDIVETLMRDMKLSTTKILEGIFPDETGNVIKENEFRFCHIDVDTYNSAKLVTEWVWPKLNCGGIIMFDDYGFIGCEGVTKYVNEFTRGEDKLFIHNLNGHGILLKRD